MTVLFILSIAVLCLLLLVWLQKRRYASLKDQLFALKEVQEVLITKAVLKSREEERQRFVRDWHDNMGNLLSTARLLLDVVDTSSSRPLKQVQQLLEDAHFVARDVCLGAQQQSLDTPQKLVDYCKDLQYQLDLGGIQFEYSVQELTFSHLTKDQKWHFSNILKESITNIIKHAKATRIRLDVKNEDRKVQLKVADNGTGFDEQQATTPKTIQDRLSLLNGQLLIENNTPSGAIMTILF